MTRKKQAYITEFSARIIRDIRNGDASSRLELARRHKLAPSTMGIHVDRLITSGHLSQTAIAHHRGRPIQHLSLRGEVGLFIGVEFEALALHAVCVNFAGEVLKRHRMAIPVGSNAKTVLDILGQAIRTLHHQHRQKLLGIGVGAPGLTDPGKGVARHYRFIKGWRDVPVADYLRQLFSVPVAIDTNVRSAALGIRLYEKSFATDDFICVMVRSGVGAGIVRRGVPHQGNGFTSGEVGRITLPGTVPAHTVEDLCSIPAILRYANENLHRFPASALQAQPFTRENLIAAAREGDSLAREAISHAMNHLGWACHVMALLENPRSIVIVGPLSELGDWLQEELRAAVERYSQSAHIQLPEIAVTSLGESVAALGAASLAINAWTPCPELLTVPLSLR